MVTLQLGLPILVSKAAKMDRYFTGMAAPSSIESNIVLEMRYLGFSATYTLMAGGKSDENTTRKFRFHAR